MTTEHPKTDTPGADPGINLTEQSLTDADRAAMYPTAPVDHPHTDPGDGRTECRTCGKWVHLVIHSCKGIPVTAQAQARRAAVAARPALFTDADVELAHRAYSAAWESHDCLDVHPTDETPCERIALRAVLTALADAGRLIPVKPMTVADVEALAGRLGLPFERWQARALERFTAELFASTDRARSWDPNVVPVPADGPGDADNPPRTELDRLAAGLIERGVVIRRGTVDAALIAVDEAHQLAGRAVTSRALLQRELTELTRTLIERDGEIAALREQLGEQTTAPGRHVLAVHPHGWVIEHPAGCRVATPGGPALICLVEDLAREQLPGVDLAQGRYGIEANDLGDRLCILDRLGDLAPCCCEDPAGRDNPHAPGTGLHCGRQDQVVEHVHDQGGFPLFDPTAQLEVQTSDGTQVWAGQEWNEHVTAAIRNGSGVVERIITCPTPACWTRCPAATAEQDQAPTDEAG